jgi:hypothetical protein
LFTGTEFDLDSCLIAIEDAFNLTKEGTVVKVNNSRTLLTKPLKDVVYGHSDQVKALIEEQKRQDS